MNQDARDTLRAAWLLGVPQAFGMFENGDALCALGVLGFRTCETVMAQADDPWGLFDQRGDRCPLCAWQAITQMQLVAHLNDDHRLGFEKIAEVMP